QEAYRKGRLKFTLYGEKLRGRWMLVRMGQPAQYGTDKREWLLFKERDAEAESSDQGDVLEEQPLSVETGRSMEEIAADADWIWNSKEKGTGRAKSSSAKASARKVTSRRSTHRVAKGSPRRSSSLPPARTLAAMAREYDTRKQTFMGVRL